VSAARFCLRGGHHLLEAFRRLRKNHPNAELTVVSSVPEDLMERFTQARRDVERRTHRRCELNALFLAAHVFALPAAGLHSHSLLRAMAHGCVPLVSDAPGYDEYTEETSVLRIRGVRAMVYRDESDG
jgi:glycosyltransferase involved in cell wall biosynthesis